MFKKMKFYLMGCAISIILGAMIVGANVLVSNIYRLIVGQEFWFNAIASIIIFCIVFLTSFAYILEKGPEIMKN